jgi:DNA-binding FadR family transcriptional regulator
METERRTDAPTPRVQLAVPKRAYEAVYHELLVRILGGQYATGDRLPSERQLAAQLGVSRPTIREALSALESKGLVVTRVGSGTFVTEAPSPPEDGEEPGESPVEVLECRLALEVAVARLAAKRAAANHEALDLVLAAVEALERTADSEAFPDEIDQAFHRAVAQVTGNEFLCGLLEPLWATMTQRVFVTLRAVHTPAAESKRSAAQHRAIYEAIKAGDPDLAAFEMERHLRGTIEVLFNRESEAARPPAFFA